MSVRDDVREVIRARVEWDDAATWVNLEHDMDERNIEYQGDLIYTPADYPNLVLWVNWCEDAFLAVRDLIQAGELEMRPTTVLVYMADGKMLDLPVAKSVRHYKHPRWVPVAFRCPS